MMPKEMLLSSIKVSLILLIVFYSLSLDAQYDNNKGLVNDSFELPYTLSSPSRVMTLSKELYEISGLSIDNNGVIRAINDEKGILYSIDIKNGRIVDRLEFGKDDDYESIAINSEIAYITESNGNLKKIDLTNEEKVNEYNTYLSKRNDVEGSCYDQHSKKVLLACKQEMEHSEEKNERGIYAWDPVKEELDPLPYYVVNIFRSIVNMKPQNISDNLFVRLGTKHRLKAFAPSAIDIDPCTGLLYILSSRGRLLIVADMENDLKGIYFLPHKLYGQPEGLCFDDSGDLYISNEARSSKANIMMFKRI